jgi:hypothetical protein
MAAAETKTLRRNLIFLFVDDKLWDELDRFMIAFHLFQTKGRVAYRRIIGMHGGGGGTRDENFKTLLTEKVLLNYSIYLRP